MLSRRRIGRPTFGTDRGADHSPARLHRSVSTTSRSTERSEPGRADLGRRGRSSRRSVEHLLGDSAPTPEPLIEPLQQGIDERAPFGTGVTGRACLDAIRRRRDSLVSRPWELIALSQQIDRLLLEAVWYPPTATLATPPGERLRVARTEVAPSYQETRITAAIDARMATAAISANEVLARLAAVWPRKRWSSPRRRARSAPPEMLLKLHFGLPSMPRTRRDGHLGCHRCASRPPFRRVADACPATGSISSQRRAERSSSTASCNRRGLPVDAAAELGINGAESGRDRYRKSEKREVEQRIKVDEAERRQDSADPLHALHQG